MKTLENKNNSLRNNMLKRVLWKMENENSAMWLNSEAIKKLIENKLITSPYDGIRNDNQIVGNVLKQLEGKEKEALNILPTFTPQGNYKESQANIQFNKFIGFNA